MERNSNLQGYRVVVEAVKRDNPLGLKEHQHTNDDDPKCFPP